MIRVQLSAHAPIASLAAALLLAGCAAPAPGSATASTKPAASASQAAEPVAGLDALVNAAKQEGKLNIVCAPGETFRSVFDTFSKKYGIQIEALPGNGNARSRSQDRC